MMEQKKFWELVDHFWDVIHSEMGFPIVIYDTHGYIIRATEKERIGDLHAGAEEMMKRKIAEYAVTESEASANPLVREGFSCPIIVDDRIVAGFGVTGKLEVVTPLAKVASKMLQAWIKEQENTHKLERSKAKYRNIFNHSLHGIFQTTMEGRLVTANPTLAKILGYDSPEALLTAISDVSSQLYIDPKDRQRILALIEKNGYADGFITKLRQRDNTVIDVKINAGKIFDQQLNTTLTEGFIEDITAKNKAEAAIRLSEEKFFKAFNNCPVWVVLSSLTTGKYLEVNETFLRTMGYERDEVIGHTSLELNTWQNPLDRERISQDIKEKRKIDNFEVARKTKDGTILNMLFWGEFIEIAGEDCLISVSMDITEKKQAELKKVELEKALAHSQKMDALGQLVGGIAHDFNNMLGGIMGAAEMLALHLPEDSEARRFQKIILDSAGRSADLTMKLLAFSRNTPQVSSNVDIHNIINETAIILENTIDRRISLLLDLGATVSTIVGDPSQLQNVLLNLGINSWHAMSTGGTLTISTRNSQPDSATSNEKELPLASAKYIEIEVKDTGCGIPPENLDKIFDPFFTTKEQGKGTGLGLAALYGTVQQHKGSVKVKSEVGQGTCFQVILPAVSVGEVTGTHRPVKKRGSGTILVVDDEEVMQLTAKAILEDLGYDVMLAENGMDALRIYQEGSDSFDLVILDMVMPVMDGSDCFKALIHYDPKVRVLLSSGFTREEDLKGLKELGLAGFIRKPYRSAEFSEAITAAVRKSD